MRKHSGLWSFLWTTGTAALLLGAPAHAATTVYTSEAAFKAALGASYTDQFNYSQSMAYSDAQMSSMSGETDYHTTGFANHNLITGAAANPAYCAGCNGSFELLFNDTSFTSDGGVYGFGANFYNNGGYERFLYSAFITYSDGSNENFLLPRSFTFSGAYFGITSDIGIASVHFALNNEATREGSFGIDNLTIGSVSAVPEPGTWAMMLFGFGVIGFSIRVGRRRRVAAPI